MMTGEGHIRTRRLTFWATRFGRGDRRIGRGKFFINFSPAVSDKAVRAIREEIRSWNLHLRSDNWIDHWPAGPIANTKSCADTCAGRRIGWRGFPVAIRSCGRTGSWACGVAPWREPYELRGSSTVLRERRGEIPRRYSPRGAGETDGIGKCRVHRIAIGREVPIGVPIGDQPGKDASGG